MLMEDFIINVFCVIDDLINFSLKGKKLRQRGFEPDLSDSEVITMEIVAEHQGIDTDKGAWKYFVDHWHGWFPKIGSRSNFAKHAANLWGIKQRIQKELSKRLGALADEMHIADGFPIPVCGITRSRRSRIFRGEAGYGYCASKDEKYYGFKGNILINTEGVITDITVTAANVDERESLWDIVQSIRGVVLADKGLIGQDFQEELKKHTGVYLWTPKRYNMKAKREPPKLRRFLTATRRLVETVIGQLTEQFNIEKVRARKLWYFTHRIVRKVLAHTVCVFINKLLGNPPLQLERLAC